MGVNLNKIKEDVANVISYSQDIRNPKVDELLDSWFVAKSDFYQLFDGKLIYEVGPIKVELTNAEKQNRIDEFIDKVSDKYNYVGLVRFIKENRDNFFDNVVEEPFNDEDFGIHVPAGIKISKAFKFFIEDKEDLDAVQTLMSMLLQESKVSGTLCFSIHPLDYLSSSENTYNWRSCHALDGDYRAGNLSYMLDSSTIVCYLRGEEDAKLPRFPYSVPWNSKKWRMLLFVSDDEDALFAGRQYPFSSNNLINTIKDNFSILLDNRSRDKDWIYIPHYSWSNWHDDYIKYISFKKDSVDNFELQNKYFPLNGRLYKDKDLIQDVGTLHFNDLLYSSYYTPYYCWVNRYHSSQHKIKFHIGAEVPCLCCGKHPITNHDMMVCDNCSIHDDYVSCEYCGIEMPMDEMIWLADREMWVCPSCYEEIQEEDS